jgi:hypothetical protein
MNTVEYKAYQGRVESFFKREGINCLSIKGACSESYFSWSPCEVCKGLAGDRYDCIGYNEETRECYDYQVCSDCLYYSAYGEL